MKVNSIQKTQQNNINYKAKINLNSVGIKEYTEYLAKCKDARSGCFSSNKNIELFEKICKAFEKHPSPEILDAEVHYRLGELFNARGVIKSSKAKITDIEPSRSDDGTAPMENLFRKLLDPENKMVFNKLLGKKYSKAYKTWWEGNIKPIWKDIKETYFFEEIERGLTKEDYNRFFQMEAVLPANYVNKLKQYYKLIRPDGY